MQISRVGKYCFECQRSFAFRLSGKELLTCACVRNQDRLLSPSQTEVMGLIQRSFTVMTDDIDRGGREAGREGGTWNLDRSTCADLRDPACEVPDECTRMPAGPGPRPPPTPWAAGSDRDQAPTDCRLPSSADRVPHRVRSTAPRHVLPQPPAPSLSVRCKQHLPPCRQQKQAEAGKLRETQTYPWICMV